MAHRTKTLSRLGNPTTGVSIKLRCETQLPTGEAWRMFQQTHTHTCVIIYQQQGCIWQPIVSQTGPTLRSTILVSTDATDTLQLIDGASRRTSNHWHVATETDKENKQTKHITQTRWQNHTAEGLRVDWCRFEVAIASDCQLGSWHSERRRGTTSPPARMSGRRQDGRPRRLLQVCADGARPEWNWVEGVTHARWELWEAGHVEVRIKLALIVLEFIRKQFAIINLSASYLNAMRQTFQHWLLFVHLFPETSRRLCTSNRH